METERQWDLLSGETLCSALGGNAEGMDVRVFEVCGSTNTEAKKLARSGFHGVALLAAERQENGRGRQGRAFWSPAGSGVYFTLLMTDVADLSGTVTVTSAASVAVFRALRRLTGAEAEIKWVNDLMLNGKKICGILCESVCVGNCASVAVGIGINLRGAEFPPELAAVAGSVGNETVTRASLIAQIVGELLPFLRHPENRDWLDDYRARSCVIGKDVTWKAGDAVWNGMAVGIDTDGGLNVIRSDGVPETLRSGEITLRVRKN